ncbi:hypothetical protein [Ralstonia pseudosolanacearum]|uniref:hypothetical protein n=1 Tax=Ralstonia pseudosolanacearum TaxID=1310165 RepID=UPI001586777A|nr:hypothetical protein [Ralstonia pseudosolanacearum]
MFFLDHPIGEQVALDGLGQQPRFEEGCPSGCQQQYDEQSGMTIFFLDFIGGWSCFLICRENICNRLLIGGADFRALSYTRFPTRLICIKWCGADF